MISLAGVFPLGTLALPAVADYLFKRHLLDVGDAAESISDFSLRKNTYM